MLMPRKKVIRPGEKVGLRRTQTERTLLLESLVLIPEEVEKVVRSTPASGPLLLTLDGLDDLAGHVAAQANHAEEKRLQKALDRVYKNIEMLLDSYTDQEALTGERPPNSLAEAVDQLRGHQGPVVFRMPLAPGKRRKCSIKMTPQQRESLVRCTVLKQSLRNKIGMVSEGTQFVAFTRKELDELYDGIGAAIVHAPSPDKRRPASIQGRCRDRGGDRYG
jgi:hypothetical protein